MKFVVSQVPKCKGPWGTPCLDPVGIPGPGHPPKSARVHAVGCCSNHGV
jgi:hypothetical protein